jgi:hypothetical protein
MEWWHGVLMSLGRRTVMRRVTPIMRTIGFLRRLKIWKPGRSYD